MYLAPDDIVRSAGGRAASPFHVGETLLEQGSGAVNEDALALGRDVYIVCDGATTLAGTTAGGEETGGAIAARITAEAFCNSPGEELPRRARTANEAIRAAMVERGIDVRQREHLWSTSFAAVRVDGPHLMWAQTGDCMVLLLHEDGSHTMLTRLPGHDEEVLGLWRRLGPTTEGTIHEVLAERILAVRKTMNRSYGVLNGEPQALDFLDYGSCKTTGVTDVLLFSDGLFPPHESGGQPFNPELFAALYRSSGLRGVRDHIRTRQRDDLRCCRYPRFKIHDDISAISLQRG